MRVLILTNETNSERRAKEVVRIAARFAPKAQFSSSSLYPFVRNLWVKHNGKMKTVPDSAWAPAHAAIGQLIASKEPDLIITWDAATAQVLTGNEFGNFQSTDKLSGSTGKYGSRGTRFLILEDPARLYMPGIKDEDRGVHKYTLARQLLLSLHYQEPPEFKFAVPQNEVEFEQVEAIANDPSTVLISHDLESQGPIITTVQFTFVRNLDMSDAINVSIPLFWPNDKHNNNPWQDEDKLARAWLCVTRVLGSEAPKVQQNGMFDCTQLMQYGLIMRNYAWDTLIMQHSLFPTTPKGLAYLCSIYLSGYSYWKDEGKTLDERGKVKYRAPHTPDGYYSYLRYGALDTWYTARLCIAMWKEFLRGDNRQLFRNYVRSFMLQTGPVTAMSWGGLPTCPDGIELNIKEGTEGYQDGLKALRLLTADPDFNPNSSAQVKHFLYTVMRAPAIRGRGQSTDKRVTALISEQYPLVYPFVQALTKAKYARTENSRFGEGLVCWTGWDGEAPERYFTEFSAVRTRTARLASRKTIIGNGSGQNLQNVPGEQRRFLVADKDQLFGAIDYSQADVWHVAAACGDPKMIDTVMTPGNDSHSIHAADFFSFPLEDVLRGKKNKEPWVTDYHTGVRNLVKKVVHGTNYGLWPKGMVINIGRAAAIGLAIRLIENAASREEFYYMLRGKGLNSPLMDDPEAFAASVASWPLERLALGCEFVQNKYVARYPVRKDFTQNQMMQKLQANNRLVTTYGPHHFRVLADLNSSELQRFVASCYGQAGTSGTINNAMLRYFYHQRYDSIHQRGIRLVLQVHDENVFSIPFAHADAMLELVNMMTIEAEFNGVSFTIPVEADVSTRWGKGGAPWSPAMTRKEIVDAAIAAGEL